MKSFLAFLVCFTCAFAFFYLLVAFVAWDLGWAPRHFFHAMHGGPTRAGLVVICFVSFLLGGAVSSSVERTIDR